MGVAPNDPAGKWQLVASSEEISASVSRVARQIEADHPGIPPLLVCVLKGSFVFVADLIRELRGDYPVDFMLVRSYAGGTSSGQPELILDLAVDVRGVDVVLVEDVIESGVTANFLANLLESRGAEEVRIATLLFKPSRYSGDRPIDYVGIEVPEDFVVGYGMDFDERHRGLPQIVKYGHRG